jgi:hypothetical protein
MGRNDWRKLSPMEIWMPPNGGMKRARRWNLPLQAISPLRPSWTSQPIAKGSRTFTGRNKEGYFVGLLEILQFGNAFCSWST